jgi:hypothetical protein
MNKKLSVIFVYLIFVIFPQSGFCFSDIAQKISSQIVSRVLRSGQVVQLIGVTEDYTNMGNIEGVAIHIYSENIPDVSLRFQYDNGNWSEWQNAQLFTEPFSYRSIAWFRGVLAKSSMRYEYNTSVQQGSIEILSVGLFLEDNEEYPIVSEIPKVTPHDLQKPRIITREEWGAQPPTHGYTSHPYFTKLTLHHAAGFSASNIEEGKIQMRAIQDFHQIVRGWSDIGYHFVVDRAGNIYQGRPETVIGAHVLSHNTGNIGVCVLGCYHPPELYCNDQLTQASRDSLVKLYAWISETYDYNPYVLLGHRDYPDNYTSCPGNNVWSLLYSIRDAINIYIEMGGPPLYYTLSQNYPNPFNLQTTILFDLPKESMVHLTIFNIQGRVVKKVVDQIMNKGIQTVMWDGRNIEDTQVSAGVYLYQIEAGDFVQTKKMVLLK